MKHLTDANKDKLLAFLRSRPAAGEASLKSWGRDQRPQIPGSLVEEIADALVAEGKATCGVRTHGGRVWRAAIDAPPAPEPDVEEEPEEEPVAVAGAAEPCQRCAGLNATVARWEREWGSHGIERMVLQSEIASLRQERDAARDANRHIREQLSQALEIPVEGPMSGIVDRVRLLVAAAKTRAEAPAAADDARLRDYLLALPEHLWQRLGAARAKIAKARQAVLDAQAAESKLLAEIGAVLDAPIDEPKAKKSSRPIPGGTLIEKTLELIRTGKANDSRGVAAILGRSPGATNSDLRTLAERGLIERTAPGKYRAKEAA